MDEWPGGVRGVEEGAGGGSARLGRWRAGGPRSPVTAEEGLRHLLLTHDVDRLYRLSFCPLLDRPSCLVLLTFLFIRNESFRFTCKSCRGLIQR